MIQRRRRGDKGGERCSRAPSGAPHLLAGRRDGAGVAYQDRRIECADVDAQFQRVGGDDDACLAVAQVAFDGTAFLGQIAAAVALDGVWGKAGADGPLAQFAQQHFHSHTGAGKEDRLHAGLEQLQRQFDGLAGGAGAQAEIGVEQRRVVEDDVALAVGRAILFHSGDWILPHRFSQLTGIGDGRRRRDELRLRAVEARHAAGAAQHVGDVAAEDAPVGVHLVEYDVAQAAEEAHPAGVVRQDTQVQHIGVGDEDARLVADGGAVTLRRVAVVGTQG